jgi:hypothetical protein
VLVTTGGGWTGGAMTPPARIDLRTARSNERGAASAFARCFVCPDACAFAPTKPAPSTSVANAPRASFAVRARARATSMRLRATEAVSGRQMRRTWDSRYRLVVRIAAALVALVLAPAAGAWTTIPGPVSNIVVPSILVTQAGTELASFESPSANTISVVRAGGAPKVVVANDPIVGRTQLVQQPNGAIQLYFPNAQGIARMTSVDDGQTWAGPFQTKSTDLGGVEGAAVAPDGTVYFSQDGTGFVNVFRGLDGDTVANVFPFCCGYAESLAVDANGLVQVAFYSNRDPDGTFLYEPLNGALAPGSTTSLKPTAPHDDRVPLVSDRVGNTFMAWPPGYPSAIAFTVVRFRGGSPAGDGVSFKGSFSGGDPHMALSVDASDRLWAVWTGQGRVHAARSRTHGADFGAAVSAALPGTAYQVSAAGVGGAVDVIVNTGSTLAEQKLLPGLSVRVYRVGKQRWVQALDDGFGVPGATFTVAGKTFHGNSAGKAKVVAGSGKAAAPGYAGAAFKVP